MSKQVFNGYDFKVKKPKKQQLESPYKTIYENSQAYKRDLKGHHKVWESV